MADKMTLNIKIIMISNNNNNNNNNNTYKDTNLLYSLSQLFSDTSLDTKFRNTSTQEIEKFLSH